MKPSILISSHFAYFNVRTGMTLFVKDLAEYLSTDYDVTVHTMRDIAHDRLVVNNVTYITGASWHNKSDYDITIGHSPQYGATCKIKSFLLNNEIDSGVYADRYEYKKYKAADIGLEGQDVFVINLGNKKTENQGGNEM